MTTRYQMKEMPDLQGTGEPITYPKMVMTGQTGTRELAEYIAMTSGFSKGVTEGIICELGEALAHDNAFSAAPPVGGYNERSLAHGGRKETRPLAASLAFCRDVPRRAPLRTRRFDAGRRTQGAASRRRACVRYR